MGKSIRGAASTIRDGELFLIGLAQVNGVGASCAAAIVRERVLSGPFADLANFIPRTSAPLETVERLIKVGTSDSLTSNHRVALCETGLLSRTSEVQRATVARCPRHGGVARHGRLRAGQSPTRWVRSRMPLAHPRVTGQVAAASPSRPSLRTRPRSGGADDILR